ncbi:MAG: carbamoyltransferase HypF [Lachnospiraceae bacterium]|nr:carbamoyltransferase HypF [Lachnospiraceae bacterium]
METIRAEIRVRGVVQGVGFRPFVHRLASRYGLVGKVSNTSEGAFITAEGPPDALTCFAAALYDEQPFLARIEHVETSFGEATGEYRSFDIAESRAFEKRNTLISPDVAICPDCLRELRDPADRRYRYPFINCTNCGPRFTIIKDVPYDRAATVMTKFPMCAECRDEYISIENRRYHAEPVCCTECGPHLSYTEAAEVIRGDNPFAEGSKADPGLYDPAEPLSDAECIRLAAQTLKEHKILAVKGLGGFHLACLFDDEETPAKLRARKRRDEKPFAVMCKDTETARRFCEVSEKEQRLLESPARPIVLLKKKDPKSLKQISENAYVGVMLGYTPVHYLLFDEGLDSFVMTSANLSDLPIIYENAEALEKLSGVADAFLMNDRDIWTRCDDSLFYVAAGEEYPVRRSRGYVPYPLTLGMPPKTPFILACGAEQKASFALTKGDYIFPSQHIGDLKNIETLEHYVQQIGHFEKMFSIAPEMIVCDLHPDYLSSEYAAERAEKENLPLLKIQHHFAHMASCMADNELDGDVIGIIWDGTGLGTDGTVWGGEFLTGGYAGFERRGSLRKFRLPGGDRAVKEIWRVGASLLLECGLAEESSGRLALVENILASGLNSPVTTSMGRLFDGACSILGIRQEASYEGQGAVLLQAAAEGDKKLSPHAAPTAAKEESKVLSSPAGPEAAEKNGGDIFPYTVAKDADGVWRFDYTPMFREMIALRREGVPAARLAAMFMNTLAAMAAQICSGIREESGLSRVVLSGGCFQNLYLLERVTACLREKGFEVFRHRRVSCNDEGICLGQTAAAAAWLEQQRIK